MVKFDKRLAGYFKEDFKRMMELGDMFRNSEEVRDRNRDSYCKEFANNYNNGDYDLAYENLLKAVEYKNIQAYFWLGEFYFYGSKELNIKKNFFKAFNYYYKAAKNYHTESMYNIGYMYLEGLGVDKDYKAARKWLEQAADDGYTDALNFMGIIYAEGRGTEMNLKKAISYFSHAINQDSVEATFNLGLLYFSNGKRVEGIELFKKAAFHGSEDAISLLKEHNIS